MTFQHRELRADPGIAPGERNIDPPKRRSIWPSIAVVAAASAFGGVIWYAYHQSPGAGSNGVPPVDAALSRLHRNLLISRARAALILRVKREINPGRGHEGCLERAGLTAGPSAVKRARRGNKNGRPPDCIQVRFAGVSSRGGLRAPQRPVRPKVGKTISLAFADRTAW